MDNFVTDMDNFAPVNPDFDLDCADLFNGLPGSPRRTPVIVQPDCRNASTTNCSNGFVARVTTPLCIRKNSDNGTATDQEFHVNTPLVRTSKSLLLRRVTSDVCCTSPHLDMPFFPSPVSNKKRRFGIISKAGRRLQLAEVGKENDKHSESSCNESFKARPNSPMLIDADDENIFQLDSLKSMNLATATLKKKTMNSPEQPAVLPPAFSCPSANKQVEGMNLERSVYARMGCTFHKLRLLSDVEETSDAAGQAEARNCKRARQNSRKEAGATCHREARDGCRPRDEEAAIKEERIKNAVEILNSNTVIADGSAPFALPCTSGKHSSQNYITVDTLSRLIGGEYGDVVHHYVIIDCRYPYEYHGGHIVGATNLYCADSVDEILSWQVHKTENSSVRTVLIFHCEFSSQRAPTMMRLLRNADRKRNSHCYPCLCYPEIYLLSGGYKLFFEKYPELCEPRSYTPMNHPDFQEDLRLCRIRATTWHGSEKLSKHKNSLIF